MSDKKVRIGMIGMGGIAYMHEAGYAEASDSAQNRGAAPADLSGHPVRYVEPVHPCTYGCLDPACRHDLDDRQPP